MATRYKRRPHNPNLPVRRLPNSEYRSREYLEPIEVQGLIDAAGKGKQHPERDRALLLLMFRHGLRAQEAAGLRWDAVSLQDRKLHIQRLKNSISGAHPMQEDEVEALEALQAIREKYAKSFYVFPKRDGGRLGTPAIQRIVRRCGDVANLPIKVHPHMLRHSCGYWLANQGYDTRLIQGWLGHESIKCTVLYTQLGASRFSTIQWWKPEEARTL